MLVSESLAVVENDPIDVELYDVSVMEVRFDFELVAELEPEVGFESVDGRCLN